MELPVKPSSLNISVALHILAVLLALFGLPAILPEHKDPTPLVISVEVLPIGDISNVKPSDKPIQKEQKAPSLKTPKPVEPSAKEPPKEAAKAEPKPVEKPTEKHFDPTEGAEPKPEEKKPEPKKEEPKKEEPKKEEPKKDPKKDAKPDDEFAALLNKMKQENAPADKTAKDKTTTPENKTKSDAPYDASLPLSISERDAIRSQFVQCWRVPAGAKDAASLAVRVKIELMEDGNVKTAEVASDQKSRYGSDPFFRAAADSALRAVHKCSPLKNLPTEKYGSWREMELNFDPKDML